MTVDEMLARGMSLNKAGFWITEKFDRFDGEENDT
jgi:hypothetical protein